MDIETARGDWSVVDNHTVRSASEPVESLQDKRRDRCADRLSGMLQGDGVWRAQTRFDSSAA